MVDNLENIFKNWVLRPQTENSAIFFIGKLPHGRKKWHQIRAPERFIKNVWFSLRGSFAFSVTHVLNGNLAVDQINSINALCGVNQLLYIKSSLVIISCKKIKEYPQSKLLLGKKSQN